MTLQSAITKEWHTPRDKIYKLAQVLFRPSLEKLTWKVTSTLSNRFPKFIFKQMLASFSTLSIEQIKEKMADEDIEEIRKMNNRQGSGAGFLIDLQQTKEITADELKKITCPSLIMHSKFDNAVSLEHPYHAKQQIPHSELCILESWGHLIWLGLEAKATNQKLLDFLKRYEKNPT